MTASDMRISDWSSDVCSSVLLVISTQAPTDADMLSVWIDDAVRSDDPHTVCHVYAADAAAEVMDRGAWKAANPALSSFRSFVELEQSAEKAARMQSFENSFRNLYLNQRVTMVSAFVSPDVWKSGNVPIDAEAVLASPIYGGLDLSATTDLTALVMTARDHEGVLHEIGRAHV